VNPKVRQATINEQLQHGIIHLDHPITGQRIQYSVTHTSPVATRKGHHKQHSNPRLEQCIKGLPQRSTEGKLSHLAIRSIDHSTALLLLIRQTVPEALTTRIAEAFDEGQNPNHQAARASTTRQSRGAHKAKKLLDIKEDSHSREAPNLNPIIREKHNRVGNDPKYDRTSYLSTK